MHSERRYYLGIEGIEETDMYEDNTPIIEINNDYGELEFKLVGKEQINHYIKTGEILNGNNNTNK